MGKRRNAFIFNGLSIEKSRRRTLEKSACFDAFFNFNRTTSMTNRQGNAMAAKTTKRTKKNDTETTDEKRFRFLCLFSESGNVSESAKKAGLNRQYLYDFRDENPDFAEAWEECKKRAREVLKDEALRRAVKGVLEPVFYKGKKCGSVRKYSDSLLALLLKGAFPDEFAERRKDEIAGMDGGEIVIRLARPDELTPEEQEAAGCGG